MAAQIAFFILLTAGSVVFAWQVQRLRRGLAMGRPSERNDQPLRRWKTMARVALGQGKMGSRPVAALLHVVVYVGFVLINIEVLEILVDGAIGSHRFFAPYLGGAYVGIIGFFELLGVAVIIACLAFLFRRHVLRIPRFRHADMKGWPSKDADIILYIEIMLMSALLLMNTAEAAMDAEAPVLVGHWLAPLLSGMDENSLHWIERIAWWFHFAGILAFLNYLPRSKHFHIILAFPNTWYSKLSARGRIPAMPSVTGEIKSMMDPSYVPDETAVPDRFGAKDVSDLSFANLLNAFTCTECGRCTSACPASITGKSLSPRQIMMATRDRVEESLDKGESVKENHLLDNFISRESLWACTSCNACVEVCPLNIDPLDIILQMRQYLTMEESAAPAPLNSMMSNIENNGAPWAYPQADRAAWINE
jgi:heterodisulfide reductase subunit C